MALHRTAAVVTLLRHCPGPLTPLPITALCSIVYQCLWAASLRAGLCWAELWSLLVASSGSALPALDTRINPLLLSLNAVKFKGRWLYYGKLQHLFTTLCLFLYSLPCTHVHVTAPGEMTCVYATEFSAKSGSQASSVGLWALVVAPGATGALAALAGASGTFSFQRHGRSSVCSQTHCWGTGGSEVIEGSTLVVGAGL